MTAQSEKPRVGELAPLVWIGLETADSEGEAIVEIATIITDADLEVISPAPKRLVIHQPDEVLAKLSVADGERSDLAAASRRSTVTVAQAEALTLAHVRAHAPESAASPLCGESVDAVRATLHRHMRALHDHLHYRNIEVTSFEEMLRRWYPRAYDRLAREELERRDEAHTLQRLQRSIRELRAYRKHFLLPAAAASK